MSTKNMTYSEINNPEFIKAFKSGKKISEILHLAADKCLWHPNTSPRTGYESEHSCIAILTAMTQNYDANYVFWKQYSQEFKRILEGLKNMGLRTDSYGEGTIFNKCKTYAEAQETRYAWLKFAAMLAEEQGV